MHLVNLPNDKIRTDLIVEMTDNNISTKKRCDNGLEIEESSDGKSHYTTIYFDDITDKSHFSNIEEVFIKELKKYLKINQKDKVLVIGLGNPKSTPDSLGPSSTKNVLVTRYLSLFGPLEDGYLNVACFSPDVMGNTGIETSDIIKGLVDTIDVNKIIVIDALKTNHIERMGRTIQITDTGISPGSGIGNIRKELSKAIFNKDVIAIGVPTVVNISDENNQEQLIVTPTNIDFLIEKLSLLIGEGINICLHKNFIRQKGK